MHVIITCMTGVNVTCMVSSRNMMPNRPLKQISPQKLQLDEIVCSRDAFWQGDIRSNFPMASVAMLSAHAYVHIFLKQHLFGRC